MNDIWHPSAEPGMNGLMAETTPKQPSPPGQPGRTRLIIDTTDTIRRAVRLRALKMGVQEQREVTHSEVVNAILQEALAGEIQEVLDFPGPRPSSDSGKKK